MGRQRRAWFLRRERGPVVSCPSGTVRYAFDEMNPEAVRWARARAARLVAEVGADARAAVRQVIARAHLEGIAPREAAKLIRATVGLTERDALAVMRRQVRLMEQGRSPEVAQRMAERYANKLHRARALTIARTETMAAANEGQQQLWDQAVAAGHLDPAMRKEWITTPDELTCETCGPMNGEVAPLDGSFSIGGNPPAHPRCRCTIGLVEPRRGR